MSSNESSPQRERRGSAGPNAVLLIEDGVSDPLGVLQKPGAVPQTPGQRRQARRGSMLELSGFVEKNKDNCEIDVRIFILFFYFAFWEGLPDYCFDSFSVFVICTFCVGPEG